MIPLFKVLMAGNAASHVKDVLHSGHIAEGPRVREFEEAFSQAVWSPDPVIAVSSGTAALQLALHLAGVDPGDEVITTPMTCIATNIWIAHRGARPVWADVDPVTGNISTASVLEQLTPKTRAIVAVDWGGRPCQYRDLQAAGLPVIEDAAHAFGAAVTGAIPPGIAVQGGDFVCWSFQAIKHLTTGDGGALLCHDRALAARARKLRWFGLDRDSKTDFRAGQDIVELGYKLHMNDIAAAIGLCNLPHALAAVEMQRANAAALVTGLAGLEPRVTVPAYDPGSAYWFFNVLVDRRESFQLHMRAYGVETSQVHSRNDRISALSEFRAPRGSLPGLGRFCTQQVALPCGWWLTDNDRSQIIEEVRRWATS
jgi:dTDP-4-amino-4,6-dideoxygalactose transaminase